MFSTGHLCLRAPFKICRIKRGLQLTCAKQAAPDSSSSKGSTRTSKLMQGGRRSPERRKHGRTVKQRSREDQQRAGEALSRPEPSKAAAPDGGRFYWNITGFPFPLGPLLKRRTVRYEVSSAALH